MDSILSIVITATASCLALYAILDWTIFKRIIADRFTGRILAALSTYIASVIVYGFGGDIGGEFRFEGFAIFLIPSFVIMAIAIRHGRNGNDEADQGPLRAS